MNAISITEYSQTLGLQARTASAAMAKADAAQRNGCLRTLAGLLRAHAPALQVANAQDLERATAAGLSDPMVDRLRLTEKVIDTLALGCEQLAGMADVVGQISAMVQQPSGIRVGQMRVPIGVFAMVFESRPSGTIEASRSRVAMPASCVAARRRLNQTRPWRCWCSRRWTPVVCQPRAFNWYRSPTGRWLANSSPCPNMWTWPFRAAAKA